MKPKAFTICGVLSVLLFLNSCSPFLLIQGDGDLVTQEINIDDYTGIKASNSSIDIMYVQSDEAPTLTVTTDRNILEKYDIRVREGKLRIEPEDKYEHALFKPTKFIVTTNSTSLRKIDVSGSINFTVDRPLRTDDLEIDLAGSGRVNLNDSVIVDKLDIDIAGSGTLNAFAVEGNSFDGDIAGAGRLNLGGQMTRASFDIAGSGTIRAFDFQVEEMKCDIAGSGNIEISVSHSINAQIAGSGRIKYKGNPSHIKKDVAGSGSIKKMD
ncbi:MAG: DUF2807 domain-containing protein [Tannerellaceae bacterium]|nr:DUF2807 domain-containing protein [Tannerellaceae bacterium]